MNAPPELDPRLLRLHAADNVLTVIRPLVAGETVIIGGEPVLITDHVGLGHKLSARPIAVGEKVLKYGAPIGSASQPIRRGEHVHTHNLRSDYLPTLSREDPRAEAAGSR